MLNLATIEEFKKIIDTSTMNEIDGYTIDSFSAGVVVGVYENIKEENQKKLMSLPVLKIIDMCYRMISTKKGG